ncbi:hypothetical protein SacmaDRAFT_0945 [Saccharomonospora marina XMU15]|uniref:Zinc-finger domain-containing protein n=1 Tax=Saccharomonospora marina XMU15 TaxID=882083 RepID=H5XA73_9PSEU|nr:hypothetical protein [Saccharomonospora marina]EHR49238.1 hypothetical protein SacmaDRAFT_0945 [Saccharomonospora marina XMU15]
MSEHRGWGLPESHLLPDAVVAFVDKELSLGAHERAATHIARCAVCAAEVAAQRAASSAVRRAGSPAISAGFLASLRSIPQRTEIPTAPDSLAISVDGQLVAVQRPERVAGLRDGFAPGGLGDSAPLGTSPNVLGSGERLGAARRRAAQGAGVVVSGLVLSALALVATSSVGAPGGGTAEVGRDRPGMPSTDVLGAQLRANAPAATPTTAVSASTTTAATTTAAKAPAAPVFGPR